jgi:2-desacetyl-2-hydroxyethyl bacteriochlorophyllide A dehydrogenase
MRLVRIHGVDHLSIDHVDTPKPGPDDILLKIAACGICGTDVGFVRYGYLRPGGEPLPLGHEAAGTVFAVGSKVRGITVGQRVLLNPAGAMDNVIGNGGSEGAFGDLLLIRGAKLGEHVLPIPDGLPMAQAALVEPLAVGMHGVNRGEVTRSSKVVVFGAGPIGLAAVFWLRRRRVASVVAVDISDERLSFARRLGASATINPAHDNLRERLLELHGAGIPVLGEVTVGTDVFFDMAGGKSVIPDVIAMAQYHARLVVSAVYPQPVEFDLLKALMKELHITTAGAYPTELHDVLEELPTIDPAELAPYVSHRFRFDDFLQAFEAAKSPGSAKVMVEFV